MMATTVRLDFIVDDDDNYRTTLCRTIPAPLRRIVPQDTYNEFCTNVDDALYIMCKEKKRLHTIARIMMDIYISILVIDISLYFIRDHEYPYFPFIPFMYALFVLAYCLALVLCYYGNSEVKQLKQIEEICTDMTTRHEQYHISFQLIYKEEERNDDNEGKPTHVTHIEVNIILAALPPTNLGLVQILRGPSKGESVRIDPTYSPILEGYVGRGAYATFCTRMEAIFVQFYSAKKRPGNVGWYQLGLAVAWFVLPLVFGFLNDYAFILVGLVFFARCYCHYQIYKYESQRQKGMKSKNDIVKEIHEILNDEMSRIHPNVSFHIPRQTHVPLTDICNSCCEISGLHNLHIIHIYVITSNTETSNDEHTVVTIATTTSDTDRDDYDDFDDDNDGHNVIP